MKHILTVFAICLLMLSTSITMAAPAKQQSKAHSNDNWQVLRQPQQGDFYQIQNTAGGYKVLLPKSFGSNPLEGLPHTDGPMQVRATSEQQLCAINVQTTQDNQYFDAIAPLPELKNKQHLVQWKHGKSLIWDCILSRQQDYNGDKLVLEATAPANGKTYELLYVMPTKDYAILLSQAIWSLNSFELLEQR